jgi:hypothetical protein
MDIQYLIDVRHAACLQRVYKVLTWLDKDCDVILNHVSLTPPFNEWQWHANNANNVNRVLVHKISRFFDVNACQQNQSNKYTIWIRVGINLWSQHMFLDESTLIGYLTQLQHVPFTIKRGQRLICKLRYERYIRYLQSTVMKKCNYAFACLACKVPNDVAMHVTEKYKKQLIQDYSQNHSINAPV